MVPRGQVSFLTGQVEISDQCGLVIGPWGGLTQCGNCSAADGTSWMGSCSFYLSGSDTTFIPCDTWMGTCNIKTGRALRNHLSNPSFYKQGNQGPHRVIDAVSLKTESCSSCCQPSNSGGETLLFKVERLLPQSVSLGFQDSIPCLPIFDLPPVCIYSADSTCYCLQSSG